MHLNLISPKDVNLTDVGDRYPLGLLYLATYARQAIDGLKIKIWDLNYDNEAECIKDCENADYVGVTATTPQYPEAVRLSKKIKSKTIIGGYHASAVPEDCLQDFDIVVVGEGEKAIVDILQKTIQKGVVHSSNLDRESFNALMPARDLVERDRYNMKIEGKRAFTVISSRGCPYGCVFCNKQVSGNKWRGRSAESVFHEIEEVSERYNYDAFYILDDTFTFDRDRALKLCQYLKKKNLIWKCMTRADVLDKELLHEMWGAGCRFINLGIESIDNEVLKKIKKGMTFEQNEEIVRMAREIGIKIKGFFIVGLPIATEISVRDSADWGTDNLDYTDFYPLVVFPVCRLWSNPKQYGLKIDKTSWDFRYACEKGINNVNCCNEYMSKEKIIELVNYYNKK